MDIKYAAINGESRADLHEMMTEYYRDGEDHDTPQEEIDAFIGLLFEKVVSKAFDGRIAYMDGCPAGFVLWMMDEAGMDYSVIPGFGTILEIGARHGYRRMGLGKQMAELAQGVLLKNGATGLYVLACGKAQSFWKKCGFVESGRVAFNGLPVYVKDVPKRDAK